VSDARRPSVLQASLNPDKNPSGSITLQFTLGDVEAGSEMNQPENGAPLGETAWPPKRKGRICPLILADV
jgi:hypothetical protein